MAVIDESEKRFLLICVSSLFVLGICSDISHPVAHDVSNSSLKWKLVQQPEHAKPTSGDEKEILNTASRKMLDLAKMTMHLSADMPTLPNLSSAKNRSQIIFNAFTERPTRSHCNVTYTKSNATDGNPVNATSGIYTAKVSGLYGFIFHAVTNELNVTLPTVELLVNGKSAAMAAAYNGGNFKALTFIAGARLKPGDKVSVFVSGGNLFENNVKGSKHRASFAGTVM